MKEININIEGYNVNGICVGCLNYNRKMFYCEKVKECFKLIGEIDVPDGLVVQVCWECLAAVRTIDRFRRQILNSYEILIEYSRRHTFLNSPSDLSIHAVQRLQSTSVEAHGSSPQDEVKLAVEVDVSAVKEEAKEEAKEEPDFGETETVKSETEFFDNADFSQGPELTSDDDIQLSKLKKKKERRTKKSKKKKKEEKEKIETLSSKAIQRHQRKLKNLPTDLVELYTMSEEEMWRIRAWDVESKEFCVLKYRCSDCVIGFNSERLMNDHMQGKHLPKGPDSHQCDVCKAYFLTRDNVSNHRALHLTAYRCTECGLQTALKRRVLAHVRAHRTANLQCSTCGNEFSTKAKLSYHKCICNQARPHCNCCGKEFANKMTLRYHLKVRPENKEEKPKEKLNISCKGCNKVFHSKKSYRAHVVIHDGLTYPCPICGKLFQWKRNLARHTRNHRDRDIGATHECKECGKTFSSRDCYNNHMKLSKRHVHEDAYVHECSYCGKKFATKYCMVDHIDWDHLKRIKYQCSVCFKAFKTAKIMVAHMNNIHEGKKNREPEGEHLCEICGKSYKTVKRLKGHVWAMHTNRSTTKSFKCALCPATFTWQTSIYKHMKMMHDNKRTKQLRPLPTKKQEPYPGIELANRMQYFQHSIASNLQNIVVHSGPPQGLVQNIV